ncbi:hypothetical protein KMI8_70 [Klebsiella phage KMI8]|nr:hypothetical protein KMI8_70 [Klebsiella phage KMI8]
MKTAKLMIVNARDEHNKHRIGQIFDAQVLGRGRAKFKIIPRDGFPAYGINPVSDDEDLTIRVGFGPDDAIFHLRQVSKATKRKLLVRALKVIAKERGYTNAYVRRFGESANIGDWARKWADWYIDSRGEFNSCNTDWLHGTEHDPVNGHEWREFIQAEFDAY